MVRRRGEITRRSEVIVPNHAVPSRTNRRFVAPLAVAAMLAGGAVAIAVAGAPAASAWQTANVTITGHGYGHGRGMGQYGALGYATNYGYTYKQILAHYYGGTTLGTRPDTTLITVELSSLGVGALDVVSGLPFTAAGVSVAGGRAAQLSYQSPGHYTLKIRNGGCGTAVASTRAVTSAVVTPSKPGAAVSTLLTVCANGRAYRGTLTLNAGHVMNKLSMGSYLRGVVPRESPASWADAGAGKGMAALQAQAVAARSYTWAHGSSICDNQNCQVYGGAGLNGQLIEDARSNSAVATTPGVVLTRAGSPVSAEYSSSTGGWTAGGNFPAVPDLGDTVSEFHNWTVAPSASSVGSAFGVGTLTAINVLSRNGLGADGGRVNSLRITGTAGSTTVSGDDFRSTLDLRSDWFSVGTPAVPAPRMIMTNSTGGPLDLTQVFGRIGDQPITCDWNGEGTDTIGVFRGGYYYFINSQSGSPPVLTARIGSPGDLAVCGDWDGNGTDTVGVYRPSTNMFYLSNQANGLGLRTVLQLGVRGDRPIAGDWNGDGHDTVGVYRPSKATFYLIDSNVTTAPRQAFRHGTTGDQPVVGDWNGPAVNGKRDSLGIFRASNHTFYLMAVPSGAATKTFSFGAAKDVPLAGDWNRDRIDTVGVARGYVK